MTQPKVQVLLATYNGERFLREQIDSLLRQTYAHFEILARDDGSRDGTVAILEEYAQRFPRQFRLLPTEKPTGHAKLNFLELMKAATADYVAFSDQDDVWLPEKLALEMEAMRGLEAAHGGRVPLMVFTDLQIVDEQLTVLFPSMWKQQGLEPSNIHRFARMIAQNVATGCTELLNRPLLDRALNMPLEAHIHDWWVALLAAGFGYAAIVPQATLLYRQHSHNTLSEVLLPRTRGIPNWRYHDKRRGPWEISVRQARAFARLHGEALSTKERRILAAFLRCEDHPNRIVRVGAWLRYGFWLNGGLRASLAVLWYLWDMKAAKANDVPGRT